MIHLQCECGKTVSVDDDESTGRVTCPGCGGQVRVPSRLQAGVEPDPLPPPIYDFEGEFLEGSAQAGPADPPAPPAAPSSMPPPLPRPVAPSPPPPAPRPKATPAAGPKPAPVRPKPVTARPAHPPPSGGPASPRAGRDPLLAFDVALRVMIWVVMVGAVVVPAVLLIPGDYGRGEIVASILALVGGALTAFLLGYLRALNRAVIALKRGQREMARHLESGSR